MDDFRWFDHWEIPKGPQRKQVAFRAQLTYCFGVLFLTGPKFVLTVYLPLPSCGIYQGCPSLLFLPSSSFFSFSFPLFPLLPLVFWHRYKHEHFPQAGFSPDSAFVLCVGITGVHYHACPGEGVILWRLLGSLVSLLPSPSSHPPMQLLPNTFLSCPPCLT